MHFVLMLVLTSLISSPAFPSIIDSLDQEFALGDPALQSRLSFTRGPEYAQSFTVGESGLLSRVELNLLALNRDMPVTLRLYDMSNSLPHDSLATAEAVVTKSSNPAWIEFDLSAAGILVEPGQVYAIGLSTAEVDYVGWISSLWSNPPVTYDGGSIFTRISQNVNWVGLAKYPNTDLEFRTYVAIPEPSTLALLLTAVGGLLYWRRSR
jgi:hypothetical protein